MNVLCKITFWVRDNEEPELEDDATAILSRVPMPGEEIVVKTVSKVNWIFEVKFVRQFELLSLDPALHYQRSKFKPVAELFVLARSPALLCQSFWKQIKSKT